MSLLAASSQKKRALARPRNAAGAPVPGRSSFGQAIPRVLLAITWAFAPGAVGLALALWLDGWIGWGLGLLAAHQLTAWCLMLGVDRPVTLRRADWVAVAVSSGLTILLCAPAALPWLLLPVPPAYLLRRASRHGPPPRVAPVMRIFSIASFVAVLMQLAGDRPGLGVIVAAVGATILGLAALERLVAPTHPRPPR